MANREDLHAVSPSLDRASTHQSISWVHLRRGRPDRAALALRQAQRCLADAELALLAQVREGTLRAVRQRRLSKRGSRRGRRSTAAGTKGIVPAAANHLAV
jgi:hypothetical protein